MIAPGGWAGGPAAVAPRGTAIRRRPAPVWSGGARPSQGRRPRRRRGGPRRGRRTHRTIAGRGGRRSEAGGFAICPKARTPRPSPLSSVPPRAFGAGRRGPAAAGVAGGSARPEGPDLDSPESPACPRRGPPPRLGGARTARGRGSRTGWSPAPQGGTRRHAAAHGPPRPARDGAAARRLQAGRRRRRARVSGRRGCRDGRNQGREAVILAPVPLDLGVSATGRSAPGAGWSSRTGMSRHPRPGAGRQRAENRRWRRRGDLGSGGTEALGKRLATRSRQTAGSSRAERPRRRGSWPGGGGRRKARPRGAAPRARNRGGRRARATDHRRREPHQGGAARGPRRRDRAGRAASADRAGEGHRAQRGRG